MATIIDKPLLALLRKDIDAALKAVGEKHGLSLSAGNAKFLPETATFKLEVRTIGSNGTAVTREMTDLRHPSVLAMHNLTAAHLTQEFTSGGKRFVLSGYRMKASKNPFLAKCLTDGKNYIFSEDGIHRCLGIARAGLRTPAQQLSDSFPNGIQ
jgi:hypothetical protein